MKKLAIIILLLYPATIAFANPVVDPATDIGFIIVLGSALGLEVLITATILYFCHMAFVPLLIALFAGNLIMYFVIFQPVLSGISNIFSAETIIIIVEGIFIKVVSRFDVFQLEEFKRLRWTTAFIVAAVGNALSYSTGLVIG